MSKVIVIINMKVCQQQYYASYSPNPIQSSPIQTTQFA